MKRRHSQIRLDNDPAGTPAYKQIADQLRTLIIEGALNPGDFLPPVRRLALELGVHFNTIAQAYRTLSQEGLLEITRGHRAVVVERNLPKRADPQVAEKFRQKIRELIAVVRARGLNVRQIAGELKIIADGLENQ